MHFAVTLRVVATLLLSILISGAADAATTPPILAGAKLVSAENVATMQAAGAVVIDPRVASEYAGGHIMGAVNAPYREKSEKSVSFDPSQDEFNLAELPADKGAAIVIYCNGPDGWKSFKAATAAIKGGYTNIYWYREGVVDWMSKGLSGNYPFDTTTSIG
jgi:rhodanese-related sulfurtransferase